MSIPIIQLKKGEKINHKSSSELELAIQDAMRESIKRYDFLTLIDLDRSYRPKTYHSLVVLRVEYKDMYSERPIKIEDIKNLKRPRAFFKKEISKCVHELVEVMLKYALKYEELRYKK